jgi:hypothetical protein
MSLQDFVAGVSRTNNIFVPIIATPANMTRRFARNLSAVLAGTRRKPEELITGKKSLLYTLAKFFLETNARHLKKLLIVRLRGSRRYSELARRRGSAASHSS